MPKKFGCTCLSRRFVRIPGTRLLFSFQFLVLLALFLFCVVGVFLLTFLLSNRSWVHVGRSIGHANMASLALLLMPVSRTSPVLHLLGIDFISAISMHKLIARCFILFVLAHSVTMSVFWARGMLGDVLHDNPVGVVAALCAAAFVLIIASMSWFKAVRGRFFELFFFLHFSFVAIIVLSTLHTLQMMGVDPAQDLIVYYLILPVGLYLFDRAYRIFVSFKAVELALIERFAESGIVKLRLEVRSHKSFLPGTFAFLHCSEISRIQWHPFAVSKAEGSVIEFEVLKVGGRDSWTSKLFDLAGASSSASSSSFEASVNKLVDESTQLMFEQRLSFRVDGPYYSLRQGDGLDSYDHVVFVSGGIGITSIKPLFKVYMEGKVPSFRFVFVFRSPNAVPVHDEFFSGVEQSLHDHFFLFQTESTLEDESRSVEGFPENRTMDRGRRPSEQEILGDVGDVILDSKCCVVVSGPEDLTVVSMIGAQARGWEIIPLSYSV